MSCPYCEMSPKQFLDVVSATRSSERADLVTAKRRIAKQYGIDGTVTSARQHFNDCLKAGVIISQIDAGEKVTFISEDANKKAALTEFFNDWYESDSVLNLGDAT